MARQLICDMLLGPDIKLVAWSMDGARLEPHMIGRRAVLSHGAGELLLVQVPGDIRNMSSNELGDWYKNTPYAIRRMSVLENQALEKLGLLETEWNSILPKSLREALRHAGVGLPPASGELEMAPGKMETVTIVSGLECRAMPGSEGTVKIEQGVASGAVGDAVLAIVDGELVVYRAVDAGGVVAVVAGTDDIHFLRGVDLGEPWNNMVSSRLDAWSKDFASMAVSAAQLEEAINKGEAVTALKGRGGEIYAPLVSWGDDVRVEVKGQGRAIVVENRRAATSEIFVPVGGKYVAEVYIGAAVEPAARAIEIYSDGFMRELNSTEATEVGLVGTMVITTVPVGAAVEERGERVDKGHSSTDDASNENISSIDDGHIPDDFDHQFEPSPESYYGDGDHGGHGDNPDDAYSLEDAWGDAASTRTVPRPVAGAEEASTDTVRVRGVYNGSVTVSNWMTVMPRGAVWAAEVAMVTSNGEDELRELGCLTQIKLLFKGFRLTRQDKMRLAQGLAGPLKKRLEEVRIVELGGVEYYIRPQGDTFRLLGPGGRPVVDRRKAKRIKDAYRTEMEPDQEENRVREPVKHLS